MKSIHISILLHKRDIYQNIANEIELLRYV